VILQTCMWRKDSRMGFTADSSFPVFHTHTHTHTHSNVCIVSSGYGMIQISTLQFSCIHH